MLPHPASCPCTHPRCVCSCRNIPTLHIVYNGSMEDLEEYAHQVRPNMLLHALGTAMDARGILVVSRAPFPSHPTVWEAGASSRSRFFTSNTLIPFNPQVAHGFRPPISPKVPPGIAALIERCWKGLPELRPTMAEVVQELEGMQLAEGEQILKYREILCGCDAL